MASPLDGSILLMSDLHSRYHVIDAQVEHARSSLGRAVDRVIVLGDFGLFGSNLRDFFRRRDRRFAAPVSFIEGNHEDFVAFEELVRDYSDVATHLPRGSVHDFGLGRWLCVGGARYMDAWSTPRGSEISEKDVERCLQQAPGSIDVVISHDCPAGIGVTSDPTLAHLGAAGEPGLTRVAEHLEPRLWFFGHHHRWHDIQGQNTRYVGLPQSWQGYALLDPRGKVDLVENEVVLPQRPRWQRWLGLR